MLLQLHELISNFFPRRNYSKISSPETQTLNKASVFNFMLVKLTSSYAHFWKGLISISLVRFETE